MTTTVQDPVVDAFTVDTLKALTALAEPVVTLLMPTRRDTRDVREDSLRLRALLEDAEAQLQARGVDPEPHLAGVRPLLDEARFWHAQAEGLAIFADADARHVFRLPHQLPELAHVGPAPRLLPLVPAAVGDGDFDLLALSQNRVRLFGGTRDSLRERDLGPIPASLEDMERRAGREPELQHQHQPAHRGVASFHGHGGGNQTDAVLDKFLLEVATGLRTRLGPTNRRPLVLAAVAEHLPRLREAGDLPTLLDEAVTGNPDQSTAAALLAEAWPIVEAELHRDHAAAADRFAQAHGTGKATADRAELVRAAAEGRVDVLLVPESGAEPAADDDLAVVAALQTGADLKITDALPGQAPVGALLRY